MYKFQSWKFLFETFFYNNIIAFFFPKIAILVKIVYNKISRNVIFTHLIIMLFAWVRHQDENEEKEKQEEQKEV